MAKRPHPLHKRVVRAHHTMVNYLMPVGLIIVAALLGYWAQNNPSMYHQYIQFGIAILIVFGALYVLQNHPKHVYG